MATKAAYIDLTEGSAPATPASGDVRIYAKTDGEMYQKDDAGSETGMAGGGGASALDDLSDVDTDKSKTPADGDHLVYDGTDWNAEAAGGGGGGLPSANAKRTAGNVTLNSTTWANVDTGLDLVVAAASGDVLLVSLSATWDAQAVFACLDAATMVSGSPVNYVGTGGGASGTGVGAWLGEDNFGSAGSSVHYVVQAGDISGGNVTLRLRYRTLSAANKTLYGIATQPLQWGVVNLGQ